MKGYGIAIVFIIILGLFLRLYISLDFYLHDWDECYHALVSKNLMHHFLKPELYHHPVLPYDYKQWTTNHIWLHKQPMTLWMIALSFKLFGVNEIALRLPSILASTLCIYWVYFICRYLTEKKYALLAAFLFAINGLVIEMAGGRVATDHVDSLFTFFIISAVYISIRYRQKQRPIFVFIGGVILGFAILTKWLTALIILPIWFFSSDSGSYIKRLRNIGVMVFVAALIALPWQIYILKNFPREAFWEYEYNRRHIFEVLEGHSGTIFYYLDKIRIQYGEWIYLPLVWIIYRFIRKKAAVKERFLFIWFFIPFVFFSLVQTKMPGYILFTAPVLFIYTAMFYSHLAESGNYRIKKLSAIFLVIVLGLSIRYSIERIKPLSHKDRHPKWVRELKKLNTSLDQNENYVLLNYPKPVHVMFYTSVTAYNLHPDQMLINELTTRGYKVILNTSQEAYADLNGVERVYISLPED